MQSVSRTSKATPSLVSVVSITAWNVSVLAESCATPAVSIALGGVVNRQVEVSTRTSTISMVSTTMARRRCLTARNSPRAAGAVSTQRF